MLQKLSRSYKEYTGHDFDTIKHYEPGEHIFSTGEKPVGIYYIRKGCVKIICLEKDGTETILRLAGKNEFIGYRSLINLNAYKTCAVVLEPTDAVFIPKSLFLDLLQKDIEFANTVVKIICEEVDDTETKFTDFVTKSGKQRLATLLASLKLSYQDDPAFKNDHIRLQKKEIAKAIGVTPESISRFLAEFKNEGIIETVEGNIKITDNKALLKIANIYD